MWLWECSGFLIKSMQIITMVLHNQFDEKVKFEFNLICMTKELRILKININKSSIKH